MIVIKKHIIIITKILLLFTISYTQYTIAYKHIISIEPGCLFDKELTIIQPFEQDFIYICKKDYRGKGPVTIKADPQTGKPIEIYVQTPSSNAVGEQKKFSNLYIKIFNYIGSIEKKGLIEKKTPLFIDIPTLQKPFIGYIYKPTTGELANKYIYILIRYSKDQDNQEIITFYRSRQAPSAKALWTEFWSIEGTLSDEDTKNIKIDILPDGNCEINLPGWQPIILPLGTKELRFDTTKK